MLGLGQRRLVIELGRRDVFAEVVDPSEVGPVMGHQLARQPQIVERQPRVVARPVAGYLLAAGQIAAAERPALAERLPHLVEQRPVRRREGRPARGCGSPAHDGPPIGQLGHRRDEEPLAVVKGDAITIEELVQERGPIIGHAAVQRQIVAARHDVEWIDLDQLGAADGLSDTRFAGKPSARPQALAAQHIPAHHLNRNRGGGQTGSPSSGVLSRSSGSDDITIRPLRPSDDGHVESRTHPSFQAKPT